MKAKLGCEQSNSWPRNLHTVPCDFSLSFFFLLFAFATTSRLRQEVSRHREQSCGLPSGP